MVDAVAADECPIKVIREDVQVNELLCFVACKSNIITNAQLSKLCCDTYDESTIREAKDLLLKSVSLPNNDKRKTRRRTKVKTTNMQDILSIYCEMKPGRLPKFVAEDLNNLPPLTLDNFDMGGIIQQMNSMKLQLKTLQEAQEATMMVHAALCNKQGTADSPRVAPPSPPTPLPEVHSSPILPSSAGTVTNLETTRGVDNDMNGDNDDLLRLAVIQGRFPPIPEDNQRQRHQPSPRSSPPPLNDSIMSNTSYSSMVKRTHPSMFPDYHRNVTKRDRNLRNVPTAHDAKRNNHQRDVITGTASGNRLNLRVASPRRPNPRAKYEECVGVFVSRLHKDTRKGDIMNYILDRSGLSLRCDPVPTQYNSYVSYCIRASAEDRSTLLRASFWPRGVIVREYNKVIY